MKMKKENGGTMLADSSSSVNIVDWRAVSSVLSFSLHIQIVQHLIISTCYTAAYCHSCHYPGKITFSIVTLVISSKQQSLAWYFYTFHHHVVLPLKNSDDKGIPPPMNVQFLIVQWNLKDLWNKNFNWESYRCQDPNK